MQKVLELPLETDIGPLCAMLRHQGFALRVVETGGRQEVWVEQPEQALLVEQAYHRFVADPAWRERLVHSVRQVERHRPRAGLWRQLRQTPVVSGLLLSLLLAGLVTGFGTTRFLRWFLIIDYVAQPLRHLEEVPAALWQTLQSGEWWRLLAPAWLHWGIVHWLFNSLGLWVFGRALERVLGGASLLGLVLVSALVSNLAQCLWSGPSFGGFSGVVYALIGAQLVGLRRLPQPGLWVPPAVIGFALVALVVGVSGVTELGGLHLANAAHVGGFLCGLLWAAVTLPSRLR